ncbi:MAG: Coenzyme F420 hydrogenase/dehydrogenase, beta subunit C-terminal domain [Desulfosarcina sp.]|nr:Coenzyme F420 hydrogenase/dehydrogenase, beta subunit C-terminal domain [Desulfosarcina sp.]MBC2744615.1 Coenzyme F420 hydrogenase/dehydrogenase, beta subunit C-terminal domain [Desulfosarcina sp.]MBC2767524.1 4Fe-4S binding protein [Desulfosarcina sp.]
MTQAIHIDIKNEDWLSGIRSFFTTVMEKAGIDAILIPTRLSVKNRIMPTLVSDPARLAEADPLSPAFPVNGAQQLAKLTRLPAGGKMAAVLRPCEIRAFNELVKLNQGKRDDVVIFGVDCPGALSNSDFRTFADQHETPDAATRAFCAAAFSSDPIHENLTLTSACRSCDHPTPDGADIAVALFGTDSTKGLTARAHTEMGETVLTGLDLPPAEAVPPQQKTVIAAMLKQRKQYRKQMFTAVEDATGSIHGLSTYLADCVNCYNCRVACPVCYCTTCVFTTDTFCHEPFQYLQWARRKGGVKMPTDTLFFHLTRMAHISTACVGCGQCTNACPNDIPLSDLFSFVAHHTQGAFGYGAGLDLSQQQPMCGFEKEEYGEVVGLN